MEVNNNYIKNDVQYTLKGIIKTSGSGFQYLNEVITFLVAFISYLNGLHGDFLHDDIFAIKNNRDVTGTNSLIKLWTNDFWGKSMSDNSSHKSYRPITVLTFRLNYALCGSEPFYFHVVNVLLHALIASLLSWMCQHRLYLSTKCSLLTGLLFAVHPVHVEAVTGLVGRAEILSALFFMISFILYTKSINTQWKYYGDFARTEKVGMFLFSMVCGVIAMLCKEQGIMVLAVCMLYDVFVICRRGILKCLMKRELSTEFILLFKRLLFTSLTILCLLIFRWWIMKGQLPLFQHQDNPASFSPYLVTRCLSYPYLWFYNIFLLLFPSTLCYDWQVGSIPLIESFVDPRNLATLFMLAVFMFFMLKWLLHFMKANPCQYPDAILFIFLFSVLPFVPASNLIFRVGFVVAERTLYIPSIGYCILIAHGVCVLLDRFPKYRYHLASLFTVLVLSLMCKTLLQNQVWNTRETLFKSGVRTLPNNAKVHYNYANMLKDKGQNDEAIHEYQIAIRLYPEHASAHNNLGTIIPNITQSMYHYERALQIYPGHQGALINLGARKFKLGNKTEGLQMLQRAMDIDRHNVEALMTLGGMMAELNRWTEAEHLYREAITEKPDFADVYYHYGTYLHLKGDIEEAVQYYRKAFSLDTHHSVSMVNAARGLRQLGKLNEAETLLDRVLMLERSAQVLDMLGLIYYQMGRTTESVNLYEEILRKNPNSTDATTHYAQVLANSGEMQRAEEMLLTVLHHNPYHTEALHCLANVLGQKGKHEEALRYLQQAIGLQKDLDDKVLLGNMYFQEANHYKDLKQYTLALESYKKTIHLNPKNSKAHVNLGAIYHLQGDFKQAKQYYHEVLKLEPRNSVALQNLAKLKHVEGRSQVKT